jgi:cell division protein FtsB
MAAKVKLLQRELKTVKADMAFSKERCSQLEEENRQLRDGNHDADEDMV